MNKKITYRYFYTLDGLNNSKVYKRMQTNGTFVYFTYQVA